MSKRLSEANLNEGEFKLRRRTLLESVDYLLSQPIDKYSLEVRGALMALKTLIEDAKKEKPRLETIIKEYTQKYPNDLFTQMQMLTEYYNRDAEWTKKWLGVVDNKKELGVADKK